MIYGKVAQKLADKGFAVTPLQGKVPKVSGWESTTSQTILTDEKYDNYNIGLLCGEPSGVIVADIDTPDKELEQKLYALMPETPVMKKGKKGINFFYKYTDEETIKIHNPINTRKVEFELISTGRQTVIPRSIHPETKKPYIWCDKFGELSKRHLLNVELSELPSISKETIQAIRDCIEDHFEAEKKALQEKKASIGVAGLLEENTKLTHKDLPDYNPKKLSDIEDGYQDRCRSGSHDSIVKYMMALISKGENKETVIQSAMKYDQDYNIGYKYTYFTCRTCKARGETPYQKAEYYYDSSKATIVRKKDEVGEKMPIESDIVTSDGLKEMDAINNMLTMFGVHYDPEMIKVTKTDTINLMKEGRKDFFVYDGKKWCHCEQPFFDSLYIKFGALLGQKKTHNAITATFQKFSAYIPSISRGQSFFKMNPYVANFNNGTLHLIGLKEKKLVFRPHNRHDFITGMINLEYGKDTINAAFEDMLDRIFCGDQEKYFAIQEMFGLALIPAVARIYFLYGVSGSGKSTIGKIISYMIGEENICSVDPSSLDGFNMESMIGKKVNMDMDISVAKPISDGQFKKIEDGNLKRIRRKGKEDIYASTPSLNIYGANSLPKNFDGSSGAYARRVSIIRFDKSFTDNGQSYDRDFAEKIYKENPEGVLNFAVKGLKRLIENNFVFTVPESGQEEMEKWILENDTVGLFIADMREGEVSGIDRDPIIDKNQSIPSLDLWKIFEKWLQEVGKKHSKIGRNKFYEIMQDKGFAKSREGNVRIFKGMGYVNVTQTVEQSQETNYSSY